MVGLADTSDAGCGTFADGGEQAWPTGETRLVEHPVRACAHREGLEKPVQAVPKIPHLRVWAKIPGIAPFSAARHPYARHAFPHRDGEVRIGFVITEHDIEPRVEFLDPCVFEGQRLKLSADHRPFQASCGEHHGLGAGMQLVKRLEIVRQTVAQVLRLTDVNDPALAVTPLVYARFRGNVTGFRAEKVS